jgi:hypothetical protein
MTRMMKLSLIALVLAGSSAWFTGCRSGHDSHESAESREQGEEDEADEDDGMNTNHEEEDEADERGEKGEKGAREETITLAQAPEAVRSALTKLPPLGEVTSIERITQDEATSYEIAFESKGAKSSVTMTERGEVMELEKPAGELPHAVTQAIAEEMHGAKVLSAESVQLTFYEVVVERNGKKHEVKIAANGHVVGGEERE